MEPAAGAPAGHTAWRWRQLDVWLFRRMGAGHGARAGLPSTHAAVRGSVVGFMAVAAPAHPLLALLGATALVTAWARVYVGAHFPRDVLLGLVMVGSLGWAGAMLVGPA